MDFYNIWSLKNMDSQQQLDFSDEVVFYGMSRQHITLDLIGQW